MQLSQQVEVTTEELPDLETTETKPAPKIIELDIDKRHPKYGNLKVLISTRWLVITIGPDYKCFVGGFIFFAGMSYLLCRLVSAAMSNHYLIIAAYLLSLLQCGSYLLVALSNPGICLRQNNSITQVTSQNVQRVCKKCGAEGDRRTYHCRLCDVCVRGYDHHCPWTSKCIGAGNLYRFYAFVAMTPIYIVCSFAIMISCVVMTVEQGAQQVRTAIPA